jgi:integrase/recombinase XerC
MTRPDQAAIRSIWHAPITIAREMTRWLSHLRAERRLSPKTLEAYARDVRQCLTSSPTLGQAGHAEGFAALEATDIRAFMAMRRADDIAGRSLMRALAGLRSFGSSWNAKARARSARCRRSARPRSAKTCRSRSRWRRPNACRCRRAAGEERDPWILARDAAVMALLYGSGLRISEAWA